MSEEDSIDISEESDRVKREAAEKAAREQARIVAIMAKKRSSVINKASSLISGEEEGSKTNETDEDADIVKPLEASEPDEID